MHVTCLYTSCSWGQPDVAGQYLTLGCNFEMWHGATGEYQHKSQCKQTTSIQAYVLITCILLITIYDLKLFLDLSTPPSVPKARNMIERSFYIIVSMHGGHNSQEGVRNSKRRTQLG